MKPESLGERYVAGTRYSRRDMSAIGSLGDRDPGTYKHYPDALEAVSLPAPESAGGAPMWDAIHRRRSARGYAPEPLGLKELSQLLWAMNGLTKVTSHFQFRSSPSAGALYPVETYLVANNVEGIDRGIFHHDIRNFKLEMLRRGDFSAQVAEAGLGQNFLAKAAVVFVWTAVVARARVKYQDRAYRYLYMDAGHIGQNLYLAAAGMGLGCCAVGAFFDDEVEALVGADGKMEIALYMGAVGKLKNRSG
ncbi:MAG: SagB/ThcOx family dehydrogenase [bacterium]